MSNTQQPKEKCKCCETLYQNNTEIFCLLLVRYSSPNLSLLSTFLLVRVEVEDK